MSKEILMQNPVTKELFWVSKSKSLGKGFHVSENKRLITKEEEFLIWFGGELKKGEILKEIDIQEKELNESIIKWKDRLDDKPKSNATKRLLRNCEDQLTRLLILKTKLTSNTKNE